MKAKTLLNLSAYEIKTSMFTTVVIAENIVVLKYNVHKVL